MFRGVFSSSIQEYEYCMKHGIKRELIPLVKIRNIGRVRARRLYNNGFTSPEKILMAGEDQIIPILGHGVTSQIFRDLKGLSDNTASGGKNNHYRPTLFQFGNGEEEQ
jgi:helicase